MRWVVSWVVKLEKKKTKIDVLMCVNVYRNDIKCLESDHIKTLLIGLKTKKQQLKHYYSIVNVFLYNIYMCVCLEDCFNLVFFAINC